MWWFGAVLLTEHLLELGCHGVTQALVAFGHHMQIVDIARLGKLGGIQKVAAKLLGHARKRLGAAVAPKEIAFMAQLPRTRSGKIMRGLLKARELGLPEGDTSTLEGK